MSESFISLKNIYKSYGVSQPPIKIIQGVNLQLKLGSAVSIRGSSGSGKSTLLKIMAGILKPDQGDITIEGFLSSGWDDDEWAKFRAESVGFVFQDFQLIRSMTVLENIKFSLMLKGFMNDEELARYWINEVGMSHRIDHYPDMLSGGEQQRVAIARAFANKPKLILADEPTGSVDHVNRDHVIELFEGLIKTYSPTVVIVTHDHSVAALAHKQYQLLDGLLCEFES